MRIVKLVEGLKIREIPYVGDSVSYVASERISCHDSEYYVYPPVDSTTKVVPVHHFATNFTNPETFEIETNDYFVAYTEEVQDLLKLPLDTYRNGISELNKSRDAWKDDFFEEQALRKEYQQRVHHYDKLIYELNGSFWLRLKLLFGKVI